MKILICVVCFPDPVIFSSVFCIYRRMFRSVCDLIFAHFGRYGGSFCVCVRVYGYDISYGFCFCAIVQALLQAFRGCFFNVLGYPGLHFLSFGFDASLIPAGDSAHKPGTGRRLWEGRRFRLRFVPEVSNFFVILPPLNARFSRLVPATRIFLCGLAVCFSGVWKRGEEWAHFAMGSTARTSRSQNFCRIRQDRA